MRHDHSKDRFGFGEKSSYERSEPLMLGLCYGSLLDRINHLAVTGRVPLALVIRGPSGVGKRTLCRFIAAQVLGINPWLHTILNLVGRGPGPVLGAPGSGISGSALGTDLGLASGGDGAALGIASGSAGAGLGDDAAQSLFAPSAWSDNHGMQAGLDSQEIMGSLGLFGDHHATPLVSGSGAAGAGLGTDLGLVSGAGISGSTFGIASGPAGHRASALGIPDKSSVFSDVFGQFTADQSGSGWDLYASGYTQSMDKDIAALNQHWVQDKNRLNAHPEYITISVDPGMDDIRTLHQKLAHTRHSQASWRIVVLPEAQLLSTATTNALLKLIESPPPQTLFLLTATGALSKTLASRCASYTMAPLDPMTVVRLGAPVGPASSQSEEHKAEESKAEEHKAGENRAVENKAEEHKAVGNKAVDAAARNQWAVHTPHTQNGLEDPVTKTLFLKMAQGCVGRMHYWQERMSFVKEGWDLFHRCALGDHMIDQEWLKTAITMGPHLWEMVGLWAHDMSMWAYEQDFFWHWDGFWQTTLDLIRDHEIYHTDLAFLMHTICARIQGFFAYYRLPPMPLLGPSSAEP